MHAKILHRAIENFHRFFRPIGNLFTAPVPQHALYALPFALAPAFWRRCVRSLLANRE